MGALTVLLHAFARHGRLQAIAVAKANVKKPIFNAEDFQWRIGHIRVYATLAAGERLIPAAEQPLRAQGLLRVAIAPDGAQAARPFMRHYPWPNHPVQYDPPSGDQVEG